MDKYIVGQEGTDFMVLEASDTTSIYKVIARCPSRDSATAIVEAFDLVNNLQNDRISYNGR